MKKLLIVGGGNMGFAIAHGITSKGIYKKRKIIFVETNLKRTKFLRKNKYQALNSLTIIIRKNKFDAIILAVKPNEIHLVAKELKYLTPKSVAVVSIAAGITLKTLASLLPKGQPIARVMPNTPCQIGEGMSAIALNKYISKNQKSLIKNIFMSSGKIIELKEQYFNVVTAISGSGPAYFCYLIEYLANSASKLGLNERLASEMVLQTGLGTMKLLSKNKISPTSLRKTVTSPKGTTEAALKVFEKNKLCDIIHSAVKAAKNRAVELNKQ
ncbi:MAG: pyrroline-5-carboxylate reductase [Candidatus Melainabacteria bacterium]|nr:pyrroline-5-carboxylate reductase [Candidatus Melainabacteria bacterium]